MYPESRPAKRKRATLQSDAPRDNRMGWRRISVRGGISASPPAIHNDIQSFPPMPCKLRGFGGRAPDSKRMAGYGYD